MMDQNQFMAMLKEKGLKVTKQRLLVLEIMADRADEHLTAEEIYELTKESYPEIGLATIYRTIQVLLDLHIIHKVNLDERFVRYEIQGQIGEVSAHHHHHAICLKCGKILSFKDDLLDNLEQAVYESIGFEIVNHEVKLYGYCEECKIEKV